MIAVAAGDIARVMLMPVPLCGEFVWMPDIVIIQQGQILSAAMEIAGRSSCTNALSFGQPQQRDGPPSTLCRFCKQGSNGVVVFRTAIHYEHDLHTKVFG